MLCVMAVMALLPQESFGLGGGRKKPKDHEIWVTADHMNFYTEAARSVSILSKSLKFENNKAYYEADAFCNPDSQRGYKTCFGYGRHNTYKYRFSPLKFDDSENIFYVDIERKNIPKDFLSGIPFNPFGGNDIHLSPYIRIPLAKGALKSKSFDWVGLHTEVTYKKRSIEAFIIIDTKVLPIEELIPIDENGRKYSNYRAPWGKF